MNILLIFFAIPIATIILSAILETLIHSPVKVAGIFFSIFLVVAFALGGTVELLVAAIVYTIIAFITAFIVMIIRNRQDCDCRCRNSTYTTFNESFSQPSFRFQDDNVVNANLNENNNFIINSRNDVNCKKLR